MKQSPAIYAIAAMTEEGVIGVNNQLPWQLPADLHHFKAITSGHAVLMGRKTHESIGRPLPNRLNLILSRDPAYTSSGCSTIHSLDEGTHLARQQNCDRLFIIGGAEIYRLLLPHVEVLYLTFVHQIYEGDAWFPPLNMQEWNEVERISHAPDAENRCAYSFVTLQRKPE